MPRRWRPAALVVLEKRKPKRSLQTNHEFYTALLLEALGLPRDAFTGAFAVARVVGWIAHALGTAGGRAADPAAVGVRRTDARRCVIWWRALSCAGQGGRAAYALSNPYSSEMSCPV